MSLNPVIFREYDIRGIVYKDFDLDFAFNLGKALATKVINRFNKTPHLAVGYDARISSPELSEAVSNGIASVGGHVYSIGLVTTPMNYFTTFFYEKINGAIMITGSHNPPEYNGFKMSIGSNTIHGDEIQDLKKIISESNYAADSSGEIQTFNIFEDYLNRYKTEFTNLKKIPLVLDCGNGTAGCVVKKMYENAGLDPVILFEEPDGNFPNHHPDPTVEKNLKDLKKAVLDNKAAVGIGFDGDSDRIGLVDEKGNMVYGDELIALFGKHILSKNPGAKIIGDVKCSDRIYTYLEKAGGKPIMWKTGHSLIKNKIKDEKSPFGGELSGHIFFADRNYGYDDALYAGLRIVEIISETGKSVSELLSDLPKGFNTPEIRIDTSEEKKYSIVTAIKKEFNSNTDDYTINEIDGIRVSFKNGWALARASNTQPVLVLRFEADSMENLDKIRNQFESIVNPLL